MKAQPQKPFITYSYLVNKKGPDSATNTIRAKSVKPCLISLKIYEQPTTLSIRKQVAMLNPPPKQALEKIPALYSNEQPQTPIPDVIIHAHFFVAGCDWFIAEYDGDDMFFCFANLGDPINAEWGYVLYSDLKSVGQAGLSAPVRDHATGEHIGNLPLFMEYDEYWQPKPFKEIKGLWQRYK